MTNIMQNKERSLPARRALVMALLAATCLAHPAKALAQVKSANSATTVIAAPNGVPVVNIANPNGAGLSDNKFTDYNVGTNGLILNNGDSSQVQRQSQLGGAISANQNLTHSASVILNEVVSTNRSELDGYTEVVGTTADVVVANPNGITCSGCGFINTPHVTLTTGNAVINSAGALAGFHVDNGDILITGAGLDASKQDYLGLIARSVAVYGQLNAKQLDVIAGPNNVDYATGTVTANAASGTAPTLAIDSSALGGMYADRIRLVATEAGVGVRVLGDAAAGTGDFTLDGAGKIEVDSHVSATAGNIAISTSATGAGAIKTTNAHLSAGGDLTLTALGGEVNMTGGALYAGKDLTIASDTLTDEGSADSAIDNNTRYAAGNLTLTDNGMIFVGNTTIGTAGTLTATGGAFDVDNGSETIYGNELDVTTTGQISLNTASVKIQNDINLTSTASLFVNNLGANIESVAGHIDVTSAGSFTNSDVMSADAGDVTIHSNNTIQNTGTLHAGGNLSLADSGGNGGEIVQNYGTLLADNTLNLNADTLDNFSAGKIQGTQGSTFTLGTLNNDGVLIASATATDAGTINVDDLTNTATGTIQSAGDLNLNVKNTAVNNNKIIATGTGNLSLLARSGTALVVTNNATGILQAGGTLTVGGNAGGSNASIGTQDGKLLGNDITLKLTGLSNSSFIQAADNISLTDAGSTTNSGSILSSDTLTDVTTGTLTNSGTIQSTNNGSITAATLTDNTGGKIYLGTVNTATGTITGNTITNSDTIQSAGGLNLNIGTSLTNNSAGKIITGGSLTARGRTASAYDVHNNNLIQSNGALDIKGNGGSSAVNIYGDSAAASYLGDSASINTGLLNLVDGAGLTTQHGLTLTATTLTLGGSGSYIVAGKSGTGTGSITVTNALTNPGAIYSADNLTLNSSGITIGSTGMIGAAHTLNITASGDVLNQGEIYGGTALNLTAPDFYNEGVDWTNETATSVDGGNLNFTITDDFVNYNDIEATGNITVSAFYIFNEVPGGDHRNSTLSTPVTTSSGWTNGSPCSNLACNNNTWDNYTETWSDTESYTIAPTHGAKLVAGGTLNLNNFFFGENLGGIISGNTVNISTAQSSASFINDDYSLTSLNYTRTWQNHASCDDSFCSSYSEVDFENDTTSHTTVNTPFPGLITGIYANTLNASGFGLVNISSPYAASVSSQPPTGGTGGNLSGPALGTGGTTGTNTVSFGGITITLPTNPNGFFVVSKDPNSKYLIETNPLFSVGSSFLGSDYMLNTYGVDPDTIERRLGDANYEASLIRQQILNDGAAALLTGSTDEGAAMQKLMDNGDDQGKKLGLVVGTAPTAAQLASLGSDIVWMVDTVVAGQHVLAPVVYLSAATKSQIASGAVIQSVDANMQLASLNNTGGTITGSNSLNITTQGDITNTSGTIGGGNVSLVSTNGSIVNQTVTDTSGGTGNQQTSVGKTASIGATGDLSLNASQDITNTGANMSAGGNASLTAGNNITFDTVTNNQSSTTHNDSGDGSLGSGSHSESTTSSTTNLKSGLTVGGNLSTASGNDTTFAATDVNVGGNADLNTGGNLNIIARNDSTTTTSSSSSGNILSGSTTTTTDHETTNVASNFNVGGNLTSNSKGDTTIQGSNVNVTGNGSVTAGGNINVLGGQNTSNTSSSSSGTGLGVGGGVYGTQTTTDTDQKSTNVASNLNFGGNGTLTANSGDITLQGSNASAGGNLNVNATNVNVLAAQNTDVSTHTVDTTSFLSMGSNSSSGSTGANTDYKPTTQQTDMGETPSNAAGANAGAGENASGSDLTLTNHTTTTTTSNTSTSAGSSLKSGGDLTVNSTGDTTLQGATVSAGGAANLNAGGDLNIEAAQNTHTVTTSTDSTSVGLYSSSQNSATSGANGGYTDGATGSAASDLTGNATGNSTGSGTAGAQASSDNKLDLVRNSQSTTTTTDITHTGTTITSGGNTTLGAENDINIAGSSVNAGGSLDLNAGQDLNVTAVQDSHTVSTTSSNTSAGLYADAGANASATGSGEVGSKYGGVDTQASGTASADANAGVGLEASNTTASSTSGSTTALTSSLTSGGDMTRTAGGTITDQGTSINAGGNFTQTAAAWNSEAAQNTTFSTSGSATNTAKLGLYADANASKSGNYDQNATSMGQSPSASAGVSANYEQDTSGASSSTSNAVVSNIHAGGGFTSTTTGASSLQGTNVNADGDLNLNAASLNYTAAQNTSTTTNSTGQITVGLKVGKGTGGYSADLSGGANALGTTNSSTNAVAGSLASGGNLNVNTSGDATFEGTNLSAKNNATVQSTGGNVTFNAAQNTTSSSQNYQGFTGDISGNQKGGSASFNGGTNSESSASSTAVTSTVSAGNGLTVKANNALTMQGTNLNSGGDTTLGANTLDYQAAQNTSSHSQATQTLDAAVSGSSDGKGNKSGGGAGSYVNTNTSGSSSTAVTGAINAGGNLTVNTAGDQTYTGTNISAGKDANISSTGGAVSFNQAQNTASSSSTQWGVSASGSGSSSQGGDSSKQGGIGGGYQTNTSATTTGIAGNIKTGGTLDVTSDKDLTLQGTNITTGGDTSLQSTGGSVNYQATTSTATGSGWGVNAQLSASSKSGSGGDSGTKAGQVGGNYSSQNDVTETAGSINSGGAVTVKGNQDVTLVGTNVTSAGNTTVAATNGNVNINAATSTQNDQNYAAALGAKNTSGGSGASATSKNTYNGGVDVAVNETSTQTGATFKTGSLNVSSGKDTNLTGTNIQTTGDTSLNAGGNLNLAAAESTNGGVNLNASITQPKNIPKLGPTGIPLIQSAGVNGGANYQGVNITSGGNLNTTSGGTTTMQATQANVGGTANIDAAGGLDKTTTTSGGIDVGFKLSLHPTGSASLDLPSTGTTQINAKGGTTVSNAKPGVSNTSPGLSTQQTQAISKSLTSAVSSAPPALQSSLTTILNNANLSTADKFKQMTTAINNDPTLSQADKAAMLSALAAQQKSLSGTQTSP